MVGNTLELVDASEHEGTFEKIAYITNGGAYFLRVVPYVAASESYNFSFIVDSITKYDAYEPNEYIEKANAFTDGIDIIANIDNGYDEDWYKLKMTSSRSVGITLSNAPAGNHYAVFVYDESANSLGNFLVDGSASRKISLTSGDYYIRVLSYTGSYTRDNYKLNVVKELLEGELASGHVVELNGDQLLINGVAAQINGEYMSHNYTYYRVNESITNFGDLKFVGDIPLAWRHRHYVDGKGYKTSTVVLLVIEDGYYHCFNGRDGYWSHYFDTRSDSPLGSQTDKVESIMIAVDLDTGKVVDNEHSMHYTSTLYGLRWETPVRY